MTIPLSQTDIAGHSRAPPSPSPQIPPEKIDEPEKKQRKDKGKVRSQGGPRLPSLSASLLSSYPLPGAKETIRNTRASLRTVRTAGVALVSLNIALTDGAHSLSHSHSL